MSTTTSSKPDIRKIKGSIPPREKDTNTNLEILTINNKYVKNIKIAKNLQRGSLTDMDVF